MNTFKKYTDGLQQQKRQATKHGNNNNTKKLWRAVENTTRYQSDPIGHVINVSKEIFNKRDISSSKQKS